MIAGIEKVFYFEKRRFSYWVFVPEDYTPLYGMKCISLLLDRNAAKAPADAWMRRAREKEYILVGIRAPENGWRAEDADAVMKLLTEQLFWMNGGFATLSAYRYLAGVGDGCLPASRCMQAHGSFWAAAVLSHPTGCLAIEKAQDTAELPVLFMEDVPDEATDALLAHWKRRNRNAPAERVAGLSEFSFEEMLSFMSRFRRVSVTPEYGESLPVRDMSRLIRRRERLNGLMRTWHIALPERIAGEALPVVFALHGITSNGERFLEQTEWDLLAQKYGFIAVAPTGYLHRWNIYDSEDFPDDAEYVDVILEQLKAAYPIDETRIYAMGFSMGAAAAELLQMKRPFTFAAAACFSGHLTERNDDAVMFQQPEVRGTEVYAPLRHDIPRRLIQFYGECEPATAYPGNPHRAAAFWKRVYGVSADAEGVPYPMDERLTARAYEGRFGVFVSVMEKGLTHTYYTDLCEWVYRNVFIPARRPANPVRSARRSGNTLEWDIDGKEPEWFVLTTETFRGKEPLAVRGTERRAELPAWMAEETLWMIPVYPEGSAGRPFVIGV